MLSTSNLKRNPSSFPICRNLLLPPQRNHQGINDTVAHSRYRHRTPLLLPHIAFSTQPLCHRKGQYVQGCITSHDLERLKEKVHELNQGEQEEPTKPGTEESTNETETELVSNNEEEESDKEPVKYREPRIEPEEEPVKLSVEPKYTTLLPTSVHVKKKVVLRENQDKVKG
ncbi:hypothetical protein PVK06_008299 [Gossypium arboreum]|uniref:Uncharacterized protein n=1 Tax=Gossypium arboreum TaxID=29729 RepID=A0ABR0QJL0_GOSAR|nr:hypothetical protein PVK06_008299 [Gossypium arboreum]